MLQRAGPRIVLASASASRRALLAAAGLTFDVQAADVDEAMVKRDALVEGVNAETAALRLADLKAAVVRHESDALVIGADQILVCNGVWFDKPVDATAAVLILVGVSMFQSVATIDFSTLDGAVPAFVTVVLIPLTLSITQGILWGFLLHALLFAVAGRWRGGCGCGIHRRAAGPSGRRTRRGPARRARC